jgi:hypothetical protein
VAGAGRCRWAWLHRHGQHNPAGITPQSKGHHWASTAAAEPLPRKLSARLITIRELSDSGSTYPASITPSGAARLVARRTRSSWWRWPPWCWRSARSGHAPSPSLRRPAPRRPGLPPAAAAGVGRRHPRQGGSSRASRRGPHKITRPQS